MAAKDDGIYCSNIFSVAINYYKDKKHAYAACFLLRTFSISKLGIFL